MLYAQVDELSIGEIDKRGICACAASLRDAQVDALCVKLMSAKYLKKREMDE